MKNCDICFPLVLAFLAGLCTLLGSAVFLLFKDIRKTHLQFFLGLSAGVMIYVSFVELLAQAVANIGFLKANLAFFFGIGLVMLLDFLVPHQYLEETNLARGADSKMLKAGILVALGIAIHNFPEGVAVFIGAISNIKLGIALAVAIALHNIPEGIAVSIPVYYGTKSRKKALLYSFLAGIVEPLGAVVALLFLMPLLTPAVLYTSFAVVAGIMVFISFDELLPMSYCGERAHLSIFGVILGMLVMALSLHAL